MRKFRKATSQLSYSYMNGEKLRRETKEGRGISSCHLVPLSSAAGFLDKSILSKADLGFAVRTAASL